jgi:GNAT superfamily N-acetyltransferase
MWVVLLACDRRVNTDGTALCLFAPVSVRGRIGAVARLAVLGLFVTMTAAALVVLWAPLFWLTVVSVLVLLAPGAWSCWKNRRKKAVLESYGPDSPAVYVHSVARVPGPEEKGAGADLMEALTAEADSKGWRLSLDAGAPALAGYYRRFGFEVLGEPVDLTWGSAVRMAREPATSHD